MTGRGVAFKRNATRHVSTAVSPSMDRRHIWVQIVGGEGDERSSTGGRSQRDDRAHDEGRHHWVVTGPHIMMVGLGVKRVTFPPTLDPDPTKPYVMWPRGRRTSTLWSL